MFKTELNMSPTRGSGWAGCGSVQFQLLQCQAALCSGTWASPTPTPWRLPTGAATSGPGPSLTLPPVGRVGEAFKGTRGVKREKKRVHS